jgi:hypothetical protein
MRDLTGIGRDHWHSARHTLDQYPPELFLPVWCRATGRAQHVEGIEILRHTIVGRVGDELYSAVMTTRKSAHRLSQWPASNDHRLPRGLHRCQRVEQYIDTFLWHEPSDEADDVLVRFNSELSSNGVTHRGVSSARGKVDARRNHPHRPCSVDRPLSLDLVRRPRERHPAAGPLHHARLEQAHHRRVMLRNVLERRRNEARVAVRQSRDLRRREDVWLLPHVNDVPLLPEERSHSPGKEARVRMPTQPQRERSHLTRLVGADVEAGHVRLASD